MSKTKKLILAFSFILQILIIKWLSFYPEFIEAYYSNGLYQITSKLLRYVFGWIPFSVGDLFYTVAGIYIIRWFIISRKRILKDTQNWALEVLTTFSIIYFAFHLFWGMNYYRVPVHKTLSINNTYSTEELKAVSEKLIDKANDIHLSITNNDTIKVEMPFSKRELLAMSDKSYEKLATIHPQLKHSPSSTKLSLFSLPLTYMGFSGYLNPLTNEAQIDGLVPLHKYPTTICHEKAHQIGYAAENEANFIGFLAANYNEDVYFKYASYRMAFGYLIQEVRKRDPKTASELWKKIHIGILKDFQNSNQFWKAYQNPFEPWVKKGYNVYLKANKQEKGTASYNYVVDLLISYFEEKS